ncbi:hypothetical protein [Streptomyces microflavus]|uniref:hypothetical protein n=1 Tax=Streptomyces microflavus TaxID=1919 RepID=UPI0037F4E9C7
MRRQRSVSSGDVPADVLGVGVGAVQVGVEHAADLLNVVVADEQVARAGAKVEAETAAALVASGVRQPVEVVDVQADASAGGGVLWPHIRSSWARCAACAAACSELPSNSIAGSA